MILKLKDPSFFWTPCACIREWIKTPLNMWFAGIFLYVALVDMMPELSSGHSHPISAHRQKEAHWLALVLQVLGMFSGVFIMLTIALYEHDLKKVFTLT